MKGRAKSLPVIQRKSRRKKVWFVAYVRNPCQFRFLTNHYQACARSRYKPKNSGENPGCFRARWETLSGTREIYPKRAPKSLRAREVFGSFEKHTPAHYNNNSFDLYKGVISFVFNRFQFFTTSQILINYGEEQVKSSSIDKVKYNAIYILVTKCHGI